MADKDGHKIFDDFVKYSYFRGVQVIKIFIINLLGYDFKIGWKDN